MRNLSLLVVSVALAAGLALADEGDRLDQKVLWKWQYPEHARFVPEAILHHSSIEELPLEDNARRRLASELSRVALLEEKAKACEDDSAGCEEALSIEERAERELQELDWHSAEQREGLRRMTERSLRWIEEWKASHPGPCQYASRAGIYDPVPEAFDFSEHLAHSPSVFLGRVVDTVVGWSSRTNRVGTLVYVEIEEIFRNEHGHVWPGKLVAYEQPSGSIELRGVRLCTVPEPGRTLVDTGDRILAFGLQFDADEVWSELSRVYPVVDGEILPQPRATAPGIEPVPLTEFRAISESAGTPEVER